MAITTVEPAGTGLSYVPIMLGQASERVSNQEAGNEMISRGYRRGVPAREAPPISPVAPPVKVARMGKTAAIGKAVDQSLVYFRQAKRCRKAGGCALSTSLFDRIAARSALLATRFLAQGAVSPRTPALSPVSPAPRQKVRRTTRRGAATPTARTLSTAQIYARMTSSERRSYSRLRTSRSRLAFMNRVKARLQRTPVSPAAGLYGTAEEYIALGQNQIAQPGMTTWDWVSVIANAASGAASTLDAYAQAQADRERAGQTASLTAAQMKLMINEVLSEHPELSKKDVEAATKGAAGDAPPSEMPGWLLPVVGGVGILAIVAMTKR